VNADHFSVTIDGVTVFVPRGLSVAAALMNAGLPLRASVQGEPRSALCGMGVCHECRLTIDGRAHVRACLVAVAPGMIISRNA
jgi:D-hydroxyproline dehydrogenase subunit gamma